MLASVGTSGKQQLANVNVLVLMALTVVMVIPSFSVIGSGVVQPTLPAAIVTSHSDAIARGSQTLPVAGNVPAGVSSRQSISNADTGSGGATPALRSSSEASTGPEERQISQSLVAQAPATILPQPAGKLSSAASDTPYGNGVGSVGPTIGISGEGTSLTSGITSQAVSPASGGGTSPPVYETGTVAATVAVGASPYGVVYDNGNGYTYVVECDSSAVGVISGTTVVATVGVETEPFGVGYDSGNGDVYVANYDSNSVSVISGTTAVATVPVGTGSNPYGVGYDSGNGYVYITDNGNSKVSVISGTTVVATVNVGAKPTGVGYDYGDGDVYVANQGSNSVSVISGTTVVATMAVGTNPYGVAYSNGNGNVYVANQGSNNVSVISGTKVATTVDVEASPYGVAYDSGNGYVYVSNGGSNSVSVISGTTVVATIGVGTSPTGLGYDSENGGVYVANNLDSTVDAISTILDVGTLGGTLVAPHPSVMATVPVGVSPDAVGYGNGDVYVANQGSNSVSVISGTTVVATVNVGTHPRGVGYDGGNGDVYVANYGSDSVSVISGTTVVATVGVGTYPWAVGYDSGNGDVYVANFGSSNLSVISGATNKVVANIGVGSSPHGVGYDSENGEVYVANIGSNSVSVISGTTVVATVGVGTEPAAVGYDSGNGCIYVANAASNNVSVISEATVVATVGVGNDPWGVGYDNGNGSMYVVNAGSNSVSVITSPWGTVSPQTFIMDVGQDLLLIAPLVFVNPGILAVSATVSPATGLGCTGLSATLTSVSGVCTATSPGTYTATLTATGTLGSSVWTSDTVTVTSDPAVSAPTPTRAGADVGQIVLFSAVAGGGPGTYSSYAWSAPTVLGCASSTSNTLTCVPTGPVSSGAVSVNVTDTNNMTSATASRAYTVSTDPTISAPTASKYALDVGQSALLTTSATNGTGLPSTYAWLGLPIGCASANKTTVTCAPTAAGTYSVVATIKDSNGFNVSSLAITLVVSPSLHSAGLSSSRSTMDVGQSAILSARISGGTGTYSYGWTGLPSGCTASNSAILTCMPQAAGSFVVWVWTNDTNGASSSASTSLTVSVDPIISAPLAAPSALDLGQNAMLAATATNGTGRASEYAWSGLPSGCLSSDSLSITCSPTEAGTYSVSVSIQDSNGFNVSSSTLVLMVSPVLGTATLAASRTSLDVGQTATLLVSVSGGSGVYSYGWFGLPIGCLSSNSAFLSCVPASPGTYAVRAWTNDSNGASSNASVTLTVSTDPAITIPLANRTALDIGQSASLLATASNGTGLVSTYYWLGLPGGCTGSSTLSLSCGPAVTGTYGITVSITDSNGMTATSLPVTLVISPALATPTLFTSIGALDVGQSVVLASSVSGGSGSYTYSWANLPHGCVSSNIAALTCSPTTVGAGTFSATVTVVDSNGVPVTSSAILLTVSADPSVSAITATVTSLDVGQSVGLSASATNGTGLQSTYTWEGLPVDCTSLGTLSMTCVPTLMGAYSVMVSITDSNGMTVSSRPFILMVSSALGTPSLESSSRSLDVGQSVTLSATVSGGGLPYTYVWKGLPTGCVGTNAATLVCNPSVAGSSTVSVTATDANGASLSSSPVNLTVFARLAPGSIAMTPGTLDLGQGTKLTVSVAGGSGGLSYAWSGLSSGCTTSSTAQLSCTPSVTGESWVSVEVTDSNGVVVSVGPVPLTVFPALGTPTLAASVTSLQLGGSVTLTVDASGGEAPLTYGWSGLPAGCASVNSPVLVCVPSATGTFTASVTVTDSAGASTKAMTSPVTVSSVPSQGFASGTNGLGWTVMGLALVAVLIGVLAMILLLRKGGASPPAAKETPKDSKGEETPVSSSVEASAPKETVAGKDAT